MRRLLAGFVLIFCATLAVAQENQPDGASPSFLTVDIDRLFAQSQFGERIARSYTEGAEALVAENRRIADALRAEELALAAQRPDMDPEVFQTEAEAFDEKAQAIRRAQDAKEDALEQTLAQGRAQFLEVSRPILGDLMVDRGASALLDRRSVLLSLAAIDVTDEAIERVNAALGDGTDQTDAGPSPEDAGDPGSEVLQAPDPD